MSSTVLASAQTILSVEKHPNADSLDIVQVKGYKAIVPRNKWRAGDVCIFVEPDSVLPDAPWAAFYKAKSSRVKAIKLRNFWSFGIVEDPAKVGYTGPLTPGLDLTAALGITKYEPPAPQDLNASGPYGFGIPRTDEERWQSIEALPYGQPVDVTLKVDGQSWTAFVKLDEAKTAVADKGVGGRSFLYKLDSNNAYTRNEQRYGVLAKLEQFCLRHKVSLALRGESYGQGIQKMGHNPHAKLEPGLALFSVWLVDERRYATKGDPFYLHAIAQELQLPTVPLLEKDVILTEDLIKRYSEGVDTVNGQPFEGVVINHAQGSFKVINLHYDAKK